ncbi:MAG: polyprenyl diphosphate synthase [Pseudomonadota bacterium]
MTNHFALQTNLLADGVSHSTQSATSDVVLEADGGLHVGIIMDGNGRWAARRGQPPTFGHEAGVGALRRCTEAAPACGIATLSVYEFSSYNWKRPRAEVDALMGLMSRFVTEEIDTLAANGIRLSVIGRRDRISGALREAIADAEHATRANTGLHLRIAFDYSGRAEIVRAIHALPPGDVMFAALSEATLDCAISGQARACRVTTPAVRPVDLIIRTGGDQRLSDFLTWEAAYAELAFLDILWPDFTADTLAQAICDYRQRALRFGRRPDAIGTDNRDSVPKEKDTA